MVVMAMVVQALAKRRRRTEEKSIKETKKGRACEETMKRLIKGMKNENEGEYKVTGTSTAAKQRLKKIAVKRKKEK